MEDNIYRDCVGENNCEYVKFNEHNVPYCSIDGVIQVKDFGCIPAEIGVRNEKD